jgi:hypothetical protein
MQQVQALLPFGNGVYHQTKKLQSLELVGLDKNILSKPRLQNLSTPQAPMIKAFNKIKAHC